MIWFSFVNMSARGFSIFECQFPVALNKPLENDVEHLTSGKESTSLTSTYYVLIEIFLISDSFHIEINPFTQSLE